MSVEPSTAVVIVAAGNGTRLAAGQPKAFVPIAGQPMLAHALGSVLAAAGRFQVVVVAPAAELDRARAIVRDTAGPDVAGAIAVVAGGEDRQDSVAAGLAALGEQVRTVLIHDAARALTPSIQFVRVAAEVERTGDSVIPVLPVVDTIKRIGGADDDAGIVLDTVDRAELGAVQTPQGFPRALLDAAYAAAVDRHTDDAGLVAAAGGVVRTIGGADDAFKITTPWDLRRAEQLRTRDRIPELRTGVGVDVHAFDESVPLWLGGVYWPAVPGLAGHSDGDAVCHAICDALLSAAGLGDIGGRFGTADPRFLDAHGDVFVAETVAVVTGDGWRIQNVAVQVIANEPRIGPRRHEIEHVLTALVGAPVSVAGTTTDHLGFAGRGEGLTAIATALIAR